MLEDSFIIEMSVADTDWIHVFSWSDMPPEVDRYDATGVTEADITLFHKDAEHKHRPNIKRAREALKTSSRSATTALSGVLRRTSGTHSLRDNR